GRTAAQDGCEVAFARVGLELVDAPDEPRAVEAAARGDAECRLRPVTLAAPDVRHPDPAHGGGQNALLPVGQHRDGERIGEALDVRGLPVGEVEQLSGGAGGSGAGGGAGGACAGWVAAGPGASGGCGSGGASRCWRSKARFSSACAVNVSFARKDATSFAPIRPAAVTARISGVAHDAG